ncbi:hypothetical protein LCGC14_1825600 [marine sediment metagenome]|uniref:3'-phosphate/5'-hydroxy nucleic acid ligase n=1 Tax=marine sediment metagenome TaxID=412755 RepID=A0A0F9GHU4_9ZZZZ
MAVKWRETLEKIDDQRWLLPKAYKPGMRVPGLVFASEEMLGVIGLDQALEQVANVAFLPGIVNYSMAMPDIHWGYGFPIGGVAAMRVEDGVVSPGGVGFDINCGTRVLRTSLREDEVRPRLKELVNQLFRDIPAGLGGSGLVRVSMKEMDEVMVKGVGWALEHGYAWPEDVDAVEGGGALKGANTDKVSKRAKQRGAPQLGTLGSGNHFLEVQYLDEIYDPEGARALGLRMGQVLVMVHTGSRGFGYQVCDDYIRLLGGAAAGYGIALPDRHLACAPIKSPEGRDYLAAMSAAANYAWANRQAIRYWTEQVFLNVLKLSPSSLGMGMVYDVAHNIAKFELHDVRGGRRKLLVHRKGATRAFPRGHPELPGAYRHVGQPVIIPGDMGRASYVLLGQEAAMLETWGSTCHGAGRVLSRKQAQKQARGRALHEELERMGVIAMSAGRGTLAEEMPEAYKDISQVVDVVHRAGISRKVARLRPMGVVKG